MIVTLFQLIMVPGYTQEEKMAISKRHLLPKQLKVKKTDIYFYVHCGNLVIPVLEGKITSLFLSFPGAWTDERRP